MKDPAFSRASARMLALSFTVSSALGAVSLAGPLAGTSDGDGLERAIAPSRVPEGLAQPLRATLAADAYRIRPVERASDRAMSAFAARNDANAVGLTFDDDGVAVRPKGAVAEAWRWAAELSGYGRGDVAAPVSEAELVPCENRLEYRRGDVVEWYVNDRLGLEQGFTLLQPPAVGSSESEPLLLELSVRGDFTVEPVAGGRGLLFREPNGELALKYTNLVAWDATGRELTARLEYELDKIRIAVDDRGAVWPVTVDPLIVTEEAKLLPSDGAAGEYFGVAVSLSGDTALVSAHYDDDNGTESGSVYVFVRSGTTWSEQAKLTASDAASGDRFGGNTALLGNTAVIGAYRNDDAGSNSGSAYVFERTGTVWAETAKLTASDAAAHDWFGYSVDLTATTILVGAYGDTNTAASSAGSAYVFRRSGGTWIEQAKLIASDGTTGDGLGYSVAIRGNTALVGTPGDDPTGTGSGSAYVFVRSAGIWTEEAKLTPAGAAAGDSFGAGVALGEDTALVGAWGGDDAGVSSGTAHVFVRSGVTWTEEAKLVASDAASADMFGLSVAIFQDRAVIGARLDDDDGSGSGSAYVFARSGGVWTEEAKLTASDGAAGDGFGSVAVAGSTVVVGAWQDDDNGSESGSAYVFKLSSEPVVYCTAKSALVCGAPAIGFSGTPEAGATSGFEIFAGPARTKRVGRFLYSCTGPANLPFGGGYLCVSLPKRTSGVSSGTGAACTGEFRIDFNEFASGGSGGLPEACLSIPGQEVFVQCWGRDSPATGALLSDALRFQM